MTLFDSHPLARRTDPATSHQAAAEHRTRAGSNRAEVYAAVQRYPGRTAVELMEFVQMERHEVSRRLADLKNAGVVRQGPARKCRINARKMCTWWDATP